MSKKYIREIKTNISLDIRYYSSLCCWRNKEFTKRVLKLLIKRWLRHIEYYKNNKSLYYKLKNYLNNRLYVIEIS